MNTRKVTFQHSAFKYISSLDYWRLVIDLKFQRDLKELGWLGFNKREPGSVAGLLEAFSYMLKTVNVEGLSEKLIKKLHLLALKNVAMKKDKFPGQFRNNRSVSFGIIRGSNGTEKGMNRIFDKKIEDVEYDLYDGRDKEFDLPSRREDDCYVFHPRLIYQTDISNAVNSIITTYYYHLAKARSKNIFELLKVIVECIQNLELIHPFRDGNCRVFCILILNKLLLENGFSPVILEDPNRFDGYTPEELVIEIVTGMNNFKKIKKLKPSTLEIIAAQMKNEAKDTPIHTAIRLQIPALTRIMLYYTSQLNLRDNQDKTILMIAAAYGCKETVEILVEIPDIDLDARDKHGYTALMWAYENNHFLVAQLLSAKGASFINRIEAPINWIIQDHFSLQNSYLCRMHEYFKQKKDYDVSSLTVGTFYYDKLQIIIDIFKQPDFLNNLQENPIELLHLYTLLKALPFPMIGFHRLIYEMTQLIQQHNFNLIFILPIASQKKFNKEQKEKLYAIDITLLNSLPNQEKLIDCIRFIKIVQLLKQQDWQHTLLYYFSQSVVKSKIFDNEMEAATYIHSKRQFDGYYQNKNASLFFSIELEGVLKRDEKEKILHIELLNKNVWQNISNHDFLKIISIFYYNAHLKKRITLTALIEKASIQIAPIEKVPIDKAPIDKPRIDKASIDKAPAVEDYLLRKSPHKKYSEHKSQLSLAKTSSTLFSNRSSCKKKKNCNNIICNKLERMVNKFNRMVRY